MTPTRIMLVEDESIVAEDIRTSLESLGYVVSAVVASGEEALDRAVEVRPDLVLMDIILQGGLDGVGTAALLRKRCDTPVVYLTAHTDSTTLQRAKLTAPFGYIVKPFEERQLAMTIEMALYKHAIDRKVRASERLLATTLRSIGEAVITTDAAGCVTMLNTAAERLTGWTHADAVGVAVTEMLPIMQEDNHTPLDHPVIQALREGEIVHFAAETLLLTKGGSAVPIAASAAPICEAEQAPAGAVIVCQDLTARKRLEAQVRQTQKLQAIGTLAGGIAHEFNNLLMVILGYTELAMSDVSSYSQPLLYLQHVYTAGQRARDLVQQMLAFSRQHELERSPTQLHLLVKDALSFLRASLPATIDIRQDIAPDTGPVLANAFQMQEAVMHLCSNAADAMQQTGGVLKVCLEGIEVDTAFAAIHHELPPGPYARLTVQDTGHGMTPDVQAHIFEPFFTTKEVGNGTGMGLAVVHGIVTQHNGAIIVESTPGQGTTCSVYLPRLIETMEGGVA